MTKAAIMLPLSYYVGAARFELATSWSQTRRDDRATLRPELDEHSFLLTDDPTRRQSTITGLIYAPEENHILH